MNDKNMSGKSLKTRSPFFCHASFCGFLTALLIAPLAASENTDAPAGVRPNLVFVLTDDQRYDTLGCTGNTFTRTPHLDRLAAEGVLFTNAHVTSAICTPSRACYFLGQYERRHGVNFNSGTALAPEAWAGSYPVLLREAGYFTGYVGKNHVPVGAQGYDTGLIEESFDFWFAGHKHLGFYPKGRHPNFHAAKADTQVEILEEGAATFLDAEQTFIEGAGAFLKSRPKDKPFCLSVSFNVPHGAGTESMKLLPSDPELYRTAYRDRLEELKLAPNYLAKVGIRNPKLPPDVLRTGFRQTGYDYVDTPAGMKERLIRETQTVTGIDRVVGSLRAILEKQGLAENTVIVFSSDHGIMSGEFGLGGKALNYEPCLHVPMIVFDPTRPAGHRGRRSTALVQAIDVAPTLLDYAGVAIPDTVQGKSLRPLIEGHRESVREFSFSENLWSTYFGNPRIESVRDLEWKYIRYFAVDRSLFAQSDPKKPFSLYAVSPEQREAYAHWLTASVKGEAPVHEELFHLASDPHETANLASSPAYAAQLDRIRKACQSMVTLAKGKIEAPPATVPVNDENAGNAPGRKTDSTRRSPHGTKSAAFAPEPARTETWTEQWPDKAGKPQTITVTAELWTAAFQTELDAQGTLHIPARAQPYYLDGPLVLKSGQKLSADPTAEIRLKPDSNTCMVRNEHVVTLNTKPVPADLPLDTDITVEGGIWSTLATAVASNGNNRGHSAKENPAFGTHGVILLQNVRRVSVKNVTIRQSRPFGVHLANAHEFTVENITLEDHRRDGVHVNGPASDGLIRGVRGDSHDDNVALNAWEWKNYAPSYGPIERIVIEDVTGAPKGVPAANSIRILPGVKRFDDGTTLDCAISDITLRRITDIREFKLYDQPNLELGRGNDFSLGVGTLKKLHFEDLLFNHPGKIEVHANADGLTIENVRVNHPIASDWHLLAIGPKSLTYQSGGPSKPEKWTEIFSPDLDCTVRNVSITGVRTKDSPTDLPIDQVVKVIEQKLNPDYPKTTPKGGTGKGIWIR